MGFSKILEVVIDVRAEKIAFIRQGGEIIGTFSYMKGDLDIALDAIAAHL